MPKQLNSGLNVVAVQICIERIDGAMRTIQELVETNEVHVDVNALMSSLKIARDKRQKMIREALNTEVERITDNDGLDFLDQVLELRKMIRADKSIVGTNAFSKWAARHKKKLEALVSVNAMESFDGKA